MRRNEGIDSDSSSSSSEESEYCPTKEKRKYATKLEWTRVRNVYADQNKQMTVFDVEDDLKRNKFPKKVRQLIDNNELFFMFDPVRWDEEENNLTITEYALDDDKLLEFARKCTKAQNRIVADALDENEERKGDPHDAVALKNQ